MFDAIRNWVGCRRDPSRSKLMTYRHNDDVHRGFVRVCREWFEFRSDRLQTADGPKLVSSFYLVVRGREAQQVRNEWGCKPYAGAGTEQEVRGFLGPKREVLPCRAFAIEGSPEDSDASLREAIGALRVELRHTRARAMRKERISPASPLHIMPAEEAEEMFLYSGLDEIGPQVYWDEPIDDDVRAPVHHENPQPSPYFAAAQELLSTCLREEEYDSAFGDRDVWWYERPSEDSDDSQDPVAEGYSGRGGPWEVTVYLTAEEEEVTFMGHEARLLLDAGTLAGRSENSSLGGGE